MDTKTCTLSGNIAENNKVSNGGMGTDKDSPSENSKGDMSHVGFERCRLEKEPRPCWRADNMTRQVFRLLVTQSTLHKSHALVRNHENYSWRVEATALDHELAQ